MYICIHKEESGIKNYKYTIYRLSFVPFESQLLRNKTYINIHNRIVIAEYTC